VKPDAYTACSVCSIHVRALYATTQVLVAQLEGQLEDGGPLREAMENAAIAVRHLTPHIEAHLENQDHALSVELAAARNPSAPGALVLERALPFADAGEPPQ
jgi:hypothetical protein